MPKLSFSLAVLAALLMTAPAEAATTIFNENFESGLGAFTATGQVGINTGAAYQASGCCGVSGSSASLANHFVAFGSGDLPSGTLESVPFNILAGEQYTLTFDLYQLGSGFNFEDFTVEVGSLTFVLLPGGIPTLFNLDLASSLTPKTISFTLGTNMTTTLRLHSGGQSSVDSVLDNLLFTGPAGAVISGVPEPSSWAMMLVGFTIIGAAVRHRKAAALA